MTIPPEQPVTTSGHPRNTTKPAEHYTAMIATLRRRAKALRYGSWAVIVLIFGLLLLAAGTFLFARQITDAELPIDYEAKFKALSEQASALQMRMQRLDPRVSTDMNLVSQALASFNHPSLPHDLNTPDFSAPNYLSGDKENWLRILDTASSKAGLDGVFRESNFGYVFSSKDTAAIRAAIQNANIVPMSDDDEDFYQSFASNYGFISASIKLLNDLITAQHVHALTGVTVDQGDQNTPNPSITRLIQLNLNRFGPTILITFLVSILTTLYRYNVRLSAYYDGRADALELLGTPLSKNGFVRLAAALSPSLEFGKAPATPIEQVLELARLYARDKKDEED